ncbi:YfcC family protein [Polaribacter sp. IC066]|uniref:YfcC family protein n=1 Tax=Polaribacter sp. IC066 TaxID=57032 RepID=UPI0011BD9A16|nr:YfcC family protein [Polaribacter sp. IC066]TXD59555.1 YfcC family protein [Polaribacter sp. IC066]
MKKIKFPSAQTVLLSIAAFVALLTWCIPSGQYDRLAYNKEDNSFVKTSKENSIALEATQKTLDDLQVKIPIEKFTSGAIYKPISIPETYQKLEARPQGIIAFILSPLKGIIAVADIIILVLFIGGLVAIVNFTGAFEAGITRLSKLLEGKEFILIIAVTCLIALGGTTFGLAEETIAFYPILAPIFIAAKYDALVALASIYVGTSIGTMVSTTNPFSTIIASNSAGINWTTGIEGRIIMLTISLIICILYILRYAEKVKKDPTKSIIYDQKESIEKMFSFQKSTKTINFNFRLKLVLFIFAMCFVIMVYGVISLDWWFLEMTGVFFVGALLIGFLCRINETVFVNTFITGASELLSVAFIIGLARGVTVLMEDGLISDTLLFYASSFTEGMNKGLFINSIMFVYSGLAFFIPSTSGMAVLTMPIMSPLADTVALGREHIVNAYLLGVGLFNFINPTGLVLASLAMIKVGYDKWLKFVLPLVLILMLVSMAFLTVSVYI